MSVREIDKRICERGQKVMDDQHFFYTSIFNIQDGRSPKRKSGH